MMATLVTPRKSQPRVLVVDDNGQVRAVLARAMQSLGYAVEQAADGEAALDKVGAGIDLILLDAQMPGMSGFDVVASIRAGSTGLAIPILMITGNAGHEERMRAIRAGANDFIGKPFDYAELRLRCNWLLALKEAHDTIARHNVLLEEAVAERTLALQRALGEAQTAHEEVLEAHLDTIRRLVAAAEFRDHDTAMHIRRIGDYAEELALAAGWSQSDARCIFHAAQMHDVGKVGVPDAILLKPGPLDADERRVMQLHTTIGHQILRDSPSPVIRLGAEIALSHHERWDGTGYPHGLAGGAIPVQARVTAIVDFFDALTSDRPYRKAFTAEETVRMMKEERGRHFDPGLLDIFLANQCGMR